MTALGESGVDSELCVVFPLMLKEKRTFEGKQSLLNIVGAMLCRILIKRLRGVL